MTFSRRFVLRSAAVTTLAVGVAAQTGCTGGDAIQNEDIEGSTIRVTLANHVWTEQIKGLIPDFEAATGATVQLTQLAEDQLSDQYNVKLNAGTNEIDVMMYRPLQENKLFASNGYLLDISEQVESDAEWNWSDFQEGPVALTSYEDAVVGVPIITERTVLYYRKDLLDGVGLAVPTTLEELKAAAAAIHEANPDVAGYIGRTSRSPAVTQFSPFLYSFGADWTEGEESGIGTPEALEAYTFYGDLIREHTNATINPEMGWPEAFAVFQQGQAAFIADADSLYLNMTDPAQSTVSESVGFAPFPAGPAGAHPYNVAAWALGISETSSNQAGAWAFLKWATSPEIVLELSKEGVAGARTSVWDSPDATAQYPAELVEAIKVNAENGVGHDRPVVIDVARAREIVGTPIVTAIAGGDVAGALSTADEQFTEFLQQDAP